MSYRDEVIKDWKNNPMRKPRIASVCLNICVGTSGEPLEKAVRILETLTGQKPSRRKAKRTIRSFGIHKGEAIACIVTVRGKKAYEILDRVSQAVNKEIRKSSFDKNGNFGFGIEEHIDIPGMKYDPDIGIYGMNVYVTLERPGYRVKKRRIKRHKIGSKHRITREEAIIFAEEILGFKVR
uniref:Large ribosomal subunit protein uL5 n=1 Tax=uncultured korarchaeote TaxID=161241 RepID=A0A1L2JK80_9CREN|nr:ribosomal protein L5 [uncultured korarchaeote]